jgi:putative oxidoreductase
MDLALLIIRVVVGLVFAGHGAQKLFGIFGGGGLEGTARSFEAINLRPGRLLAPVAGTAEVVGGALLALGLLTPVGAALVIAVMVAAIGTVRVRNGLWAADGGFEYELVLIAAAFALAGAGPGDWSLDHALGIDWSSTGWALAELAAGLVAGLGVVIIGRATRAHESREAPPHPA